MMLFNTLIRIHLVPTAIRTNVLNSIIGPYPYPIILFDCIIIVPKPFQCVLYAEHSVK